MFSGLVSHLGRIAHIDTSHIWIEPQFSMADLTLGESIAHHGICLSVAAIEQKLYRVDISPETRQLCQIDNWHIGQKIHLERALKLGDRLGGHFVFGHVDTLAMISHITPHPSGSQDFVFTVDKKFSPYLAPKGSIALNGISLTLGQIIEGGQREGGQVIAKNGVGENRATSGKENREPDATQKAEKPQISFAIHFIPHTLEQTCFGQARIGDPVLVEIDMLARYVARHFDSPAF